MITITLLGGGLILKEKHEPNLHHFMGYNGNISAYIQQHRDSGKKSGPKTDFSL